MTKLEQAAAQYAEAQKAYKEAKMQRETFYTEFKKKHRCLYATATDFQEHGAFDMKVMLDQQVFTLEKTATQKATELQHAALRFHTYA